MPKVSFLVSTYNSATYLDGCIKNLLEQQALDFDIIIINPNSPDREREVVEKWQKETDKIIYLEQDKRESYGQSWMKAWKESTSKYVCNANTDDRRPQFFGYQLSMSLDYAIEKIAFAYPGIQVFDEEGNFKTGGERQPFNRQIFMRECHSGPSDILA